MTVEQVAEGRYRAACAGGCSRPLDYAVATRTHATNLLQKHLREYHADDPAPGEEDLETQIATLLCGPDGHAGHAPCSAPCATGRETARQIAALVRKTHAPIPF